MEKPIISVNNNQINIRLCLTQCINAKIYKLENDKKIEVFDTAKTGGNIYTETLSKSNSIYSYVVVPYCNVDNKTYFGEEIFLEKIKSPVLETDDWWNM